MSATATVEQSLPMRTGRAWKVAGVAALVASLIFGAVLVTQPFSESTMTAFTDLGQLTASILGCWGAFVAAARAWRTDRLRLAASWCFIAGGVLFWAWGQAIWTGYEVVLGEEVPFPSAADVGFLGLPVLAGIGLLLWPVGTSEGRDRIAGLLDGALIGAGLLLISWATSLGATVQAGGQDTAAALISAAYPVGDVVLTAIVLVLLTRAGPTNRASLLLLSAGLVLLTVADSAFMYGTSTGSYSSGALLDLGWFGGFLAIGVAGLALGASPLSHSRHGVPGWRRMAIAHVPAGIAMAIVFYDLFTGRRLHVVEILSALVIVVALAAREFLLVAENRELSAAVTAGEAEVRGGGFHDPLTGLPTWPLFEDRVRQSLRRARRDGLARSVLVVGVDDFDLVQRRMGEATAEAVTLGVADRLQSLLRNADSVAHIGQGEFAVLLDVGHQVPERVAQRVVDGLRTTLDVGGQPLAVSASVGLASERRPDASPEDLVAQAESAMAQSRAAGRTALGDPGAIEAAIGVQRF